MSPFQSLRGPGLTTLALALLLLPVACDQKEEQVEAPEKEITTPEKSEAKTSDADESQTQGVDPVTVAQNLPDANTALGTGAGRSTYSRLENTTADYKNSRTVASEGQAERRPLLVSPPVRPTPPPQPEAREPEPDPRKGAAQEVNNQVNDLLKNLNPNLAQQPARMAGGRPPAQRMMPPAPSPQDTENYAEFEENSVHRVLDEPVSTFGADVDSGSYSNVRRMLESGQKPRKEAVRVEELINYFGYDWRKPANLDIPFAVTTELAPTPWNEHTRLMGIGLKGFAPDDSKRPPANLVFLLDTSGSMNEPNKLPLVVSSLKLLTATLSEEDRVSIVVYAGSAGVVLEPTPGNDRQKIATALEQLRAGGGTNGGEGIQLAYSLAEQNLKPDGINRVILATDGDLNVGISAFDDVLELVKERRDKGIALTTLGFGTGNYNDRLMEQLADAGNGNHAYIDRLSEARKVLHDEVGATLLTVAKDLKIQVEFNPALVAEYRLIGYENRKLKREDFRNDKVDSGDIGAGHSVTALYEIALKGSEGTLIPDLRYQAAHDAEKGVAKPATDDEALLTDELATVRVRFKNPQTEEARELSKPVLKQSIAGSFAEASEDFRFAAAVSAWGQKLRGARYLQTWQWKDIRETAAAARGEDPNGYRSEFLKLVDLSESLAE